MMSKITVTKITDKALLDLACSYTVNKTVSVKDMQAFYKSEHSPIRTQLFLIEMKNIPTFASVHFARHNVGVIHFVKSNRIDRGGDTVVDRLTPVNHMMIANAQALINISRKRLCSKSSPETQEIMAMIANKVYDVDVELALCMLPECEYRGGCTEINSCGYMARK